MVRFWPSLDRADSVLTLPGRRRSGSLDALPRRQSGSGDWMPDGEILAAVDLHRRRVMVDRFGEITVSQTHRASTGLRLALEGEQQHGASAYWLAVARGGRHRFRQRRCLARDSPPARRRGLILCSARGSNRSISSGPGVRALIGCAGPSRFLEQRRCKPGAPWCRATLPALRDTDMAGIRPSAAPHR